MSWQADLLALRSGSLSFGIFAERHAGRFQRWAKYFHERWPLRSLEPDDLAQEGIIEAWQAVDRWDPDRGVDIARFVEYRVGERMQREISRLNGWPRKDRGTKAPTMIDLSDIGFPTYPDDMKGEASIQLVTRTEQPIAADLKCERDREISRLVGDDRLACFAVLGASLGIDTRIVGLQLFEDSSTREEFGFSDRHHAAREVRKKIRTMGRKLDRSVR